LAGAGNKEAEQELFGFFFVSKLPVFYAG